MQAQGYSFLQIIVYFKGQVLLFLIGEYATLKERLEKISL